MTLDPKDPEAILDYVSDWTKHLGADTIATSDWTVTGATIDSHSNTTKIATVWLSGGVVGTTIYATNRITTAGGRTLDQTLEIQVKHT